jgi:type 1 fimbriae regulatory protein FimB/type 1 fimbriae regulatory protein FimE
VGEPASPPARQRNAERRPREYLTPAEVETPIATARKRGRYGHRDGTMILIAYRHGLRVGELCALTWDQVDFAQGLLHVARLKHGVPSVHPLGGEELRALRRLRREQPAGRHMFQPGTVAGGRSDAVIPDVVR